MSERLLSYLIEHGLLTYVQADKLRKEHQDTGKTIRELLAESGHVTEEQLVEALAAVSRLPVIRLYEQQIPI